MTYEQIVRAWNAQADEHNQYDTLSDRERIEFALRMATQHEFPIAKIVCGTGGGCSLEFTNGADSLDYAGCDVYLRPPITQEPHPPTRHCMCEDCAPSFEQTPGGMAPAVTDAMALAFHSALTDSSIGQGEIDEIKTGLRAALCAAKPVENQEPVDDLDDLLEEYWNLAYNEGKNKRVRGDGKTLDKIRALFSAKQQPCPDGEKLKSEHAKSEAAWATGIDAAPSKEKACSTHPDAPHGFDRTASHSLGRYVCICEGWEPSA